MKQQEKQKGSHCIVLTLQRRTGTERREHTDLIVKKHQMNDTMKNISQGAGRDVTVSQPGMERTLK